MQIYRDVNQHNVTAADYAVLVTGLQGTQNSKDELLDFSAHYGQVFAAFSLVEVGDALGICNKVRPSLLLKLAHGNSSDWRARRRACQQLSDLVVMQVETCSKTQACHADQVRQAV
jgi:hypothetical protein